MPANTNDGFGDLRTKTAMRFVQCIRFGEQLVEQSAILRDDLLAAKALVAENEGAAFDNPNDLDWVLAQLLALKQKYESLVDSFGGGS